MTLLTDIEIAQRAKMLNIYDVAAKLNIDPEMVEPYGKYKAKLDLSLLDDEKANDNKLILVTAITPTPAGEGKTTTTVGLADAFARLGKRVSVALREPSLGPVFGLKGGACGGGYAQLVPMEDINLHFTGDIHAITACNNLLAALLDNHIYQGNALNINPKAIILKRCLDMNERQLRNIVSGLGSKFDGAVREDGFEITVATEIMAIFCLATGIDDLQKRLGNIIVAYTYDKKPVTARDLNAVGAMTALLTEAIKPNLVQTLENTPAFVHGGPFANIAHGCNAVIATKMSQALSDYTITEAGFGADLGAEKFIDIKCRLSGLKPNAAVLVATIRALKMHGGLPKDRLDNEDLEALRAGIPNLRRHLTNLQDVFKLPTVVALNIFPTDTQKELDLVVEECKSFGVKCILSDVWAKGGAGGLDLAREVIDLCEEPSDFDFVYDLDDPIETKITKLVQNVYGGKKIRMSNIAKKEIENLIDLGLDRLPVCIAKTQYSFSDDPQLLGAPTDFNLHVKEVKVSAGAGFIVVYTGNVLTMPGLPKVPSAEKISVDSNGKISGLF